MERPAKEATCTYDSSIAVGKVRPNWKWIIFLTMYDFDAYCSAKWQWKATRATCTCSRLANDRSPLDDYQNLDQILGSSQCGEEM